MARIIPIEPDEGAAIDAATGVLSKACPVAIPTETVYGLAADATDAAAITRIYETKGRPRFNPLICHMADLAMAERYAIFDPLSRRLAERFWPGPLTMILKKKPCVPLRTTAPLARFLALGTVAVGLFAALRTLAA